MTEQEKIRAALMEMGEMAFTGAVGRHYTLDDLDTLSAKIAALVERLKLHGEAHRAFCGNDAYCASCEADKVALAEFDL